ncbi:CBU_0592 family membrane protein [Psychroserpens mesophilus]|uniref:CBU_0592 family membrane protein n=1 Tax=Psychroserpens mesophilus TaxID=325473 RepID=UPI003D645B56
MTSTDWIGFVGVFLILLAYFLNVLEKVNHKDLSFIVLNLIGATLACLASILLQYIPFIILEGAWALVSLYALLTLKRSNFK